MKQSLPECKELEKLLYTIHSPEIKDGRLLILMLLFLDSFGIEVNQTAAKWFKRVMKGSMKGRETIAIKVNRFNNEVRRTGWQAILQEVDVYFETNTEKTQLFIEKLAVLADKEATIKKPANFQLAVEFSKLGNIFDPVQN